MPSENYRYCCLDRKGQLHGTTWFEANNDDDAIEQITTKHPDAKCEIWQGKRFVASIGGHDVQVAVRSSASDIERSLDLLRSTNRMIADG